MMVLKFNALRYFQYFEIIITLFSNAYNVNDNFGSKQGFQNCEILTTSVID